MGTTVQLVEGFPCAATNPTIEASVINFGRILEERIFNVIQGVPAEYPDAGSPWQPLEYQMYILLSTQLVVIPY